MPSTLTTMDAILQEDYHGPVVEALNQSSWIYSQFKKVKLPWEGRAAVMAVHVSRDDSGTDFNSAGVLPTAGNEGYVNLSITAAKLYSRFQIDGDLLAAAKQGGKRSFIAALSAKMEAVKQNSAVAANAASFSGGQCAGWINQHKNEAGAADWEFAGDISKLDAASTGANSCTVDLIRMDTYATVSTETVDTVSTPNMTIHFTTAADTTAVGAGFAIGIRIMTSTVANFVTGLQSEPRGIYGNMIEPTHFTADRTTATNTATALQSNCLVMDPTGGHNKADVSLQRLQFMLDTAEENSGKKQDMLVVHYSQRQKYAVLLQAVLRVNTGADAKGAAVLNGGFANLAYGDLPINADRHCGRGLILGLKMDTWKYCPLKEPSMADDDGNVLARVANSDSVEGYLRAYYQTACADPRANFALVGLTHL